MLTVSGLASRTPSGYTAYRISGYAAESLMDLFKANDVELDAQNARRLVATADHVIRVGYRCRMRGQAKRCCRCLTCTMIWQDLSGQRPNLRTRKRQENSDMLRCHTLISSSPPGVDAQLPCRRLDAGGRCGRRQDIVFGDRCNVRATRNRLSPYPRCTSRLLFLPGRS